ncbi:MAG: DUF309 domain-containing protein [Candidatus Neomarinimicrobiota bacterium]|nr:DUF309 domain-containing protein [Candidatus Neomarinimicrobiota bacterium]
MLDEKDIFDKGVLAFNEKRFYDAHEYWEDLWVNHKLKDAKFIQGLIQLAVSYFHLFNQNLNGARSMMRKSMGKFDSFDMARGINILDLVDEIKRANEHINDINEVSYFNDSYIISLKVINE